MYRWVTVACAGLLLATGGVATYATAPDSYGGKTAHPDPTIQQADMSNGARLLLYTSLAERLIYRGDYEFAATHLHAAMSSASRLPAIRSVEASPSSSIFRVTLIALQDNTTEREILIAEPMDLTEPLDFSPEALPLSRYSIRNAEIHYLTGNGWNKAAILSQLQNISSTLEMSKWQEASKRTRVSESFTSLHALLLEAHSYPVSSRRAAMDEIALARALLQLQAYDAAKNALSKADLHIQRLHNEDLMSISSEIADTLHVMDGKTAGNRLDKQLAQLWKTLS